MPVIIYLAAITITDISYNYNIISDIKQTQIKHSDMLNVVVRIYYPHNTGSGVLIYRERIDYEDEYTYYVIVSEHVVRNRISTQLQVDDIEETCEIITTEVQDIIITVFRNGNIEHKEYVGQVIYESQDKDLALISFNTDDYLPDISKLPDIKIFGSVAVFDQIYAVGCQLGDVAIPTEGIVSGLFKHNDIVFLSHTAHTLPGSSGGGLFKKHNKRYYLIALMHSLRKYQSHIIPHYSSAISVEVMYKFLNENHMSFIYENGMVNEIQYTG